MSKLWMNSAHYSLFTHRSFNSCSRAHGSKKIDHRLSPRAAPGRISSGTSRGSPASQAAPEAFYENADEVAALSQVRDPLRSAVYLR